MTEWTKRFGLEGRRALVTGACGGIGTEICRVLSEAGADIAAVDRDADGFPAIVKLVESHRRRCVAIPGELSTTDGPVAVARAALEAFGAIDILVNNAGIGIVEPLLEAKVADWDMMMAVNLRAPFLLARELAPAMIAQKRGKIINISSQAGVIALDNHGAYCASKGGLNLLTKVMAAEWAKYNIQANAVCPTVILTPLGEKVWGSPEIGDPMKAKIPARRFGKPIEVADMVLYLASPASDLVCGHSMLIDGGYTAV